MVALAVQTKIPVWEKLTLTLDEASEYSNIGVKKLRDLTNDPECDFVLFVGHKRLIKRKMFEQYVNRLYSM